MRRLRPLLAIAVLFALVLGGCAAGGTGTQGITSDESPVPEGMPVMYEFYTDT